MEYPNKEPNDIFPVDSKLSVWEKIKGPLGKIVLALIFFALFLVLILSMKAADDKTNQKVSEEFRKGLIEKGSMANSVFLAGAGEIANGNNETTLTPKEKVTPDKEKPLVIASQENKEDTPAEKVVENNPKSVPVVGKDTTKKATAVAKPPVLPKKETSKAISCKDERDGKDHPKNSTTKGKHMDEDCCPDPDEWPKPGCVYSHKGLALMLSGPTKKKK